MINTIHDCPSGKHNWMYEENNYDIHEGELID